jgi:hypothetical protein
MTGNSERERIEQFYKLLAEYGLTGQSQPLNRRQRKELDELFDDSEDQSAR